VVRLGDSKLSSTIRARLLATRYLGKVFYFWYGRGTYFGGVGRYLGVESFWPELDSAQSEIQRRRTQGSQWTIEELPAGVIAGQVNSLIVTEINTRELLSAFLRSRKPVSSLECRPTFDAFCR
jgi:hypothetical protein